MDQRDQRRCNNFLRNNQAKLIQIFRSRRTNIMSGVSAPPVPFTAIQINPFHDTIDLSTADGKKLYAKATQGLPETEKYSGKGNDVIRFIAKVASSGHDFGWVSVTENIGPENTDLFKEPGKLDVNAVKSHCDQHWNNGGNADSLQFCIKSNMMYVFIKNSVSQSVIDDILDDEQKWLRPGGGDIPTLLLRTCEQNAHGTRASAIVAKSELLEVNTKNFNHKIDDVNKFFNVKNTEIALGGENPDVLFRY